MAKPRRLPSTRRAVPDSRLAEVNQVAATTGNDPALDTLLLRLHLETACRRGGALALRPQDLDPTQCLVFLREKGETVRWQPVSPTLMAHLQHHVVERRAPADRQLLRYADGRPITTRRYNHLWTRIGRELPWVVTQQVSTHWLRHTTLTWWSATSATQWPAPMQDTQTAAGTPRDGDLCARGRARGRHRAVRDDRRSAPACGLTVVSTDRPTWAGGIPDLRQFVLPGTAGRRRPVVPGKSCSGGHARPTPSSPKPTPDGRDRGQAVIDAACGSSYAGAPRPAEGVGTPRRRVSCPATSAPAPADRAEMATSGESYSRATHAVTRRAATSTAGGVLHLSKDIADGNGVIHIRHAEVARVEKEQAEATERRVEKATAEGRTGSAADVLTLSEFLYRPQDARWQVHCFA